MMQSKKSVKFVLFSIAFLLAHLSLTPEATAQARTTKNTKTLGNDDSTFIFAGRCPNGEAYRLLSSETEVDGKIYSSYTYEGPVGKGTVRTRAAPRTMAVRICRVMAEIMDDPS